MKYYFLVFIFFVSIYIVPLGLRPGIIPDEFRYAEIPHEMIVSGDYTSPRLLGCRYFEKPALGYYCTAASFKIFGENLWSLRLPSALAAGLAAMFLMIVVAQHTKDDRMSALSGLIYLCCGMVYALGTTAVLDSMLTAAVTGALAAFFLASEEKKYDRRKIFLLIVAGIATGLAFWVKGFVGVAIIGLSVLGYLLWEKRFREIFIMPWIPLTVAVLTVLPWALAVHRSEPDFWRYFIVVEHLQRFLSPSGGQHDEAFWFLWPVFIGGAFPSGFFALAAIGGVWGKFQQFCQQRLVRFAICAMILPLIFLSASGGKLATYVLPCYFPLAILLGMGMTKYLRGGGPLKLFFVPLRVLGVIFLLAGVAGCAAFLPVLAGLRHPLFSGKLYLCATALGLWGAMLLFFPKNNWRWQMAALFVGMVLTVQATLLAFPFHLVGTKMPKAALDEAKNHFDTKKIMIVTSPSLMHAVAYNYNRTDIFLTSDGELSYAIENYPEHAKKLIEPEDLEKLIATPNRPPLLFICRRMKWDNDLSSSVKQYLKKSFTHSEISFMEF